MGMLPATACQAGVGMNDHPNKHIRAAVEYAISKGWRLVKSGPRAHAWGRLLCPRKARNGCIISVYGTPRVPENHARYIRRLIDDCPHGANEGQ
jgi:hypothetical protein